jgi:hypothetical protein
MVAVKIGINDFQFITFSSECISLALLLDRFLMGEGTVSMHVLPLSYQCGDLSINNLN